MPPDCIRLKRVLRRLDRCYTEVLRRQNRCCGAQCSASGTAASKVIGTMSAGGVYTSSALHTRLKAAPRATVAASTDILEDLVTKEVCHGLPSLYTEHGQACQVGNTPPHRWGKQQRQGLHRTTQRGTLFPPLLFITLMKLDFILWMP